MIWILIFGGTLAVITALKYLTPHYVGFLMNRMVYRPQEEIDYVLRYEQPPERWRGRYRRPMKACIRYMQTSTMVDGDQQLRDETVRRLEELLARWDNEKD